MQIVEIYNETRFNPERSILKERLGEGYITQSCATDRVNYFFEVIKERRFVLGFEVEGPRSVEFLSIITADYVYQHPGIAPESLSHYLQTRARQPLRTRKANIRAAAMA